jgi:hypothetical protein
MKIILVDRLASMQNSFQLSRESTFFEQLREFEGEANDHHKLKRC